MLSGQVVELANRIPKDISAPEYLSIAQLLINQGSTTQEISTLLDAGLKVSKEINSELALFRVNGDYLFRTGKIDDGRRKYEKAMNVFSKYLVTDPYFIASSNFETEMNWAYSEYTKGECKQAKELLKSANSRITELLQGKWADNLKDRVKIAQNNMKKNSKSCKP